MKNMSHKSWAKYGWKQIYNWNCHESSENQSHHEDGIAIGSHKFFHCFTIQASKGHKLKVFSANLISIKNIKIDKD